MRFGEPISFFLMLLVVAVALFVFWSIRRKRHLFARFGDLPLIMRTAPDISFARQATRGVLLLVGLSLLVVALARLQFGTHLEMLRREG